MSSKTSCRHFEDFLQRRLKNVFGRCFQNMSWRRLTDVLKTSWKTKVLLCWRLAQDIFNGSWKTRKIWLDVSLGFLLILRGHGSWKLNWINFTYIRGDIIFHKSKVSADTWVYLPENLRKLCVYWKFPYLEIRLSFALCGMKIICIMYTW